MADRTEMIETGDGTMEVFVTYPDGPGPFPVIVQLMDGIGFREELRDHARQTAACRITSYNVCYTKLLRCRTKTTWAFTPSL